MSETSKVRHLFSHLFTEEMKVIDIGFGGDKVVPYAHGADLPIPYTSVGPSPVDIACNVKEGLPVKDNIYDIVYSSHLLEDFVDTKKILTEFIRVLKKDGILITVIPNEQKYIEHCIETAGGYYNTHHQIPEMGMDYLKEKLDELDAWEYLVESDCVVDYNVVLAVKRKDNSVVK